jgi:hypothetical protein
MAEYPYDTPIQDLVAVLVPPDPPGGELDGVTPEQVAAAEIAKHKEILSPDPVIVRLSAISDDLTAIRNVLVDIRHALEHRAPRN